MTEGFALRPPTAAHAQAVRTAWASGGLRTVLPAGTPWYRVVRAHSPREAAQYAREAYASTAEVRFSPVMDAHGIVPVAYAGDSVRVALWETVLRGIRHEGAKRVTHRHLINRHLLELRLSAEQMLVDLTRPAIAQLALPGERPPDLSGAWPQAYALTRAWAQCLYEATPGAQGFVYESHQLEGHCIVLFDRRGATLFNVVANVGPVAEGDTRRILIDEAARAGASVDFADLEGDAD